MITLWVYFLKADRKAPDSEIKLDDWVEHFSRILNPQSDNGYENERLEQEGPLNGNEYLDRPITETEVSYAIKTLKSGKSPGVDGLNKQFIKACSEWHCSLFDKSFQLLFWT